MSVSLAMLFPPDFAATCLPGIKKIRINEIFQDKGWRSAAPKAAALPVYQMLDNNRGKTLLWWRPQI